MLCLDLYAYVDTYAYTDTLIRGNTHIDTECVISIRDGINGFLLKLFIFVSY